MNKLLIQIYLLVFFLSIGGININGQKRVKKRLNPIEFYEAMKMNDDLLLVDIRLLVEYKENRIQDALPAETQKDLLNLVKDMPKNKPVFMYCDHGDRTRTAMKLLSKKGFTNLYELKGGIDSWIKEGMEVDTTRVNY